MKNKDCVQVLNWILTHEPGDYDAAIISYDSGIYSPQEFVVISIILNELGIIVVDETQTEDLRIIINDESPLYKQFKTLREDFDRLAYKSSQACAAFCSLDTFEETHGLFDKKSIKEAADSMLSEIESYEETLDKEEVPEEFIRYKILDEEGKLTEFKEFLQKFE